MRISDWSSDVCSSDLDKNSMNAAIISSIVGLASALDMETTAEGVETHDDLALVRGLGCSHVQGYIYGRPMDLAEVLVLLREGGGRAEAQGFKSTREPRLTVFRTIQIDRSEEHTSELQSLMRISYA